mmetsp:Transcript_7357/g.24210  ORF Transcript_7357/g.24210 Transcript_7357/m.24210 type:complete len:308 (-) Transcript_7357:1339-2262(-)
MTMIARIKSERKDLTKRQRTVTEQFVTFPKIQWQDAVELTLVTRSVWSSAMRTGDENSPAPPTLLATTGSSSVKSSDQVNEVNSPKKQRLQLSKRNVMLKSKAYVCHVTTERSVTTIGLRRGGAIFAIHFEETGTRGHDTEAKVTARMAHSYIDKFVTRAVLIDNHWLRPLAPRGVEELRRVPLPVIVSHFRDQYATSEPCEMCLPSSVCDRRILDCVVRGSADNRMMKTLFLGIEYSSVSAEVSEEVTKLVVDRRRTGAPSVLKALGSAPKLLDLEDAHRPDMRCRPCIHNVGDLRDPTFYSLRIR